MSKDSTRTALLEQGTRLILEQGYAQTGVQAVLLAAGVPKGSFYHHFKSKEEFAFAILDRYFEAHMANVERFLADTALPPLNWLRCCFEFYVEHFRNLECRQGCLLGNLSQELAEHNSGLRAGLLEHLRRWSERVSDCLEQARQAGEVAADLDVDHAADFCINSWEGAILRMKVRQRGPGPVALRPGARNPAADPLLLG
jgi:TetR/AcrR family transcriptional repressor of nem operon